ncbi:hypothetical protein [Brucella pituitosa]|uniref:Uncharacterized protein n=1 Tax=Brucella pituitosa TaxID=571256 RepID=A0ABS3JU41_9HYPH|nr:hypothetical protein [Brucella pituitosa]MBO1038183.1 hypothetical protein [Brucella pituitosa]
MARTPSAFKQSDVVKVCKAFRIVGFDNPKITIHPDGRIEAEACPENSNAGTKAGNSWDDA